MIAFTGYTLAELIHEGASTVVYRARRDDGGATVIIKALRSDHPTAVDRARARHEHALLSDLAGPGIVPIRSLETSGAHVALVMDDVGLSSLDQQLGARLDLGLVLRIVVELSVILRRAHQRGIVHKDIKPHNILLGTGPLRVYVIDWGIASRLGEARHEGPQPARGEGTLAYLSPEQTGMVDRPVDARSDLYSLGVTFYEMLTGVLPFTDESPAALVQAHLSRTPAPPREVDPRIPAQISDIVMRLLAKSAEDRYAGARGLELDVARCLSQLEEGGQIGPFPLGQQDTSSDLRIPQRLYGREADVAAMVAAFERVQQGSAELVLVSGHPGIGKSASVRAASLPMRLRGARFAAGKFEQLRDAAPYASLVHALRELVRQLMTERAGALLDMKDRVRGALGPNAAVLTELVPELNRLLGPQPPAPALGPIETENRFHLVMQQLIAALASAERPLVLFLDDLQWAEPASLKVIERLLTDPEKGHLLVIGAHRDQEAGHLEGLARAADDIAAGGGIVSRIALRPLTPADADRLIADALRTTPAEVKALGEEIHRKTDGNPFFVGQLLLVWARDGLITFDGDAEVWRWDLPALARSAVTDDVADLMARRLRRLPDLTQRLLKLGACLGDELCHDTLARIAGQSTPACAHALWPALVEGLLVPLHGDYRLLAHIDEDAGAPAIQAGEVTYRFLHDRVQEAAYSLLDEGERPGVHLEIARLLRGRHAGEVPDDALFTIVDHLNVGRPLVGDRAERLAAAELDLRAGRRAMASVAYTAARSYLAAGVAYLPEDAWEAAHDLSFALRRAHAESVFLCGELEVAEALFEGVTGHARSATLEGDIHHSRMQLHAAAYRFNDALRIGRASLAALGAPLPETEDACQAASDAEIQALVARVRGRTIEELLRAPPMTDARMLVVSRLLLLTDMVSFAAGCPNLSALASVRHAALSLDHGPSGLSPCGYATCAQVLLRVLGRSEEVDLVNRLALAVSERYPSPEHAPRLSLLHAHWASLLGTASDAIAAYDRAADAALQHGDLMSLQFATLISLMMRLVAGDDELDAVKARQERALTMMRRARFETASMIVQVGLQAVACLQGRTIHPSSLDDEHFDEDAFVRHARDRKMELALSCHFSAKLLVLSAHGDHEAAVPLLDDAAARLRCFGQSMQGHTTFLICLHLVALIERASADTGGSAGQAGCAPVPSAEAERYQAMLEEHHSALGERRRQCDAAWRCQDTLIAAERARVLGQDMEAQRLHEQAIAMAERGGSARLLALASDLYGKLAAGRGLDRLARACLEDAHQGFLRWGARVRADALAAQFPRLVAAATPHESTRGTTSRGTATVALQGILFDLEEAMRTARSISGELVEERIIERFVRASGKHTTITRAIAILMRGGDPAIVATWTASPDVLRATPDAPLASVALAESVVRFVARSHDAVVLNGSAVPDLFADDPHIRERRPRSILCLPLVYQDRLLGMWYAESDVAREHRRGSIEFVELLAGQAASALENARLVTEIEAANQRLRVELEDRVRIEDERSELQEQMIAMQEEMLLELSSPLIPISQSVSVLPLIGTIAHRRAAHMVESVLGGVHERRTRVLIIDVTGLREVDEATAHLLIRLATTLRMLGVEVVLTGVRPDVARTVARLRLSMKGILLRSTLQDGIAFAMRLRRRARES